jgi:mono/diheme cytochrome c family protein
MRWIPLALVGSLVLSGCGPTPEEMAAAAAAAQAAAQDSLMAEASGAFDASVFDTITWEDAQKRMDRGEQVYNFSCNKCHGPEGLGDGGFVRDGDALVPPSFREPTWRMAGDEAAIRQAIFVGTLENMPHWGMEGLKAEAIDAVTHFIMEGFPEG